ncbi:MAG TPA: lipid-binding SYLF domain-containing protein [Bryobacteraceae bacterium]|nr:lipid-binding SYLF domain-containing protein [Bryobacteraceae bacterium]
MKLSILILAGLCSGAAFASNSSANAAKLISESANVFTEITSAPDRSIPQDILSKAQCIGIVPGLKRAGFIIGAKYGKGVLTCRTGSGWSAPSIIKIEGGSFGAQIGAGETDLVLVVQNHRGMEKLMQDKFTVGGDASVMAGPVGRTGEALTDAQMHAEILSYSRARGLFAGVSLEGSTLRPDSEENANLYGHPVMSRAILTGEVTKPDVARPLYAALDGRTGVHRGAGE